MFPAGATFLGLTRLLCGCSSYEEALRLSESGNADNIDILVQDIYGRRQVDNIDILVQDIYGRTSTSSPRIRKCSINRVEEDIPDTFTGFWPHKTYLQKSSRTFGTTGGQIE